MRKELRALVFGDSASLRAAIVNLLTEFEVEAVQTVYSVAEITIALSRRSYDFVLVGGVGGGAAEMMMAAVRQSPVKANRDLPVITVLSSGNARSIEIAKAAGADNVLVASISWGALAEALALKVGCDSSDIASSYPDWRIWEGERVYQH